MASFGFAPLQRVGHCWFGAICDEAVSALDVSVKAQIVNLLQDLQQELGLALLFISRDLAIVEHLTHRVADLGKIVESAPRAEIFANPMHPYTISLLSAGPVPDPAKARDRVVLKGDVPSPVNPPKAVRLQYAVPARVRSMHERASGASFDRRRAFVRVSSP